MATTPEGKVKKRVVKILEDNGIYYFFPVTGGFGRSGVPDIICCWNGRFLAIECKSGSAQPTKLQEKEMSKIRAAGGDAVVVNEEKIELLEMWSSGKTAYNPLR